jgi:beta-lactamase class D
MRKLPTLLASLVLAFSCAAVAMPQAVERADWPSLFDAAPAVGTMAILDTRGGTEQLWVHDARRAIQRFSPASTYKIPHTVMALQCKVVEDEFDVIAWDHQRRGNPAWDKDQDLRSAMRNSTVWVYERFAQKIGLAREGQWMQQIGYGNAATTGAAPFWVEGDLAISAMEQLVFLQKLYRNELPFDRAHQRLVKDLMVNEAGSQWILRAKTGWTGSIGWWTGWVEHPNGAVFFALNIDTPNRMGDVAKREVITRKALRSLGALPE